MTGTLVAEWVRYCEEYAVPVMVSLSYHIIRCVNRYSRVYHPHRQVSPLTVGTWLSGECRRVRPSEAGGVDR